MHISTTMNTLLQDRKFNQEAQAGRYFERDMYVTTCEAICNNRGELMVNSTPPRLGHC